MCVCVAHDFGAALLFDDACAFVVWSVFVRRSKVHEVVSWSMTARACCFGLFVLVIYLA
eukprot:GDKH01020617.1.p3 GENE.GDKH01020617.1~~GDKH01020617.1.p3  ORF type:complete len:59 (+),score=2.45 GDKH01020617.1:122-298(+)